MGRKVNKQKEEARMMSFESCLIFWPNFLSKSSNTPLFLFSFQNLSKISLKFFIIGGAGYIGRFKNDNAFVPNV